MIWIRNAAKDVVFIGDEWLDFAPPRNGRPDLATMEMRLADEERAAVLAHIYGAFDQAWPFAATCRLLHADGRYRRMLVKGIPAAGRWREHGEFVGSTIEIADVDLAKPGPPDTIEVWDRARLDLASVHTRRIDEIYDHILMARALAAQQNENKLVSICDLAIASALEDVGLDYSTQH